MGGFNEDRDTSNSRLDTGCAEGVVPAQALIPFNLATEVRTKEEEAPEKDGAADSKRDSQNDTDGKLREIKTRRALENDVEDVDEDCNSKVERDSSKSPFE